MTYIENRNFDLNRILLIIIGLWPYKQSNLVRLQLILLFGIVISFIAFQLSRLIIVDYTFDFVVKMLSSMFLNITGVIQYNAFWINKQSMKNLLDQLQYIYESLKDDDEIAILEKYGKSARRYTAKVILIILVGLFSLLCLTLLPYILDIIIPKNGTYAAHIVEIICKYYAIPEKNIFLIILYVNIAWTIDTITMVAFGTMLIAYLKQICGMFKIARLATLFVSNFEWSFFFLIIFGVCCLSLNLFCVFQIVLYMDEINELLILHVVFVVVIFLYMFLANYAGQEITDHNNDVFFAAYNVKWYLAPIQVQKLILFLLQRNNKIFSLNCGGLFVASLQCFSSMASTSISYFTVMYSTQK